MKNVLITGGAGFIGSNLAKRLLLEGINVTIYDNFSRCGVEKNIDWLRKNFKNNLKVIKGDVRNFKSLLKVVKGVDTIFHLAAQVAVTTSVINPMEDFEINILGTLNVLEAAKAQKKKPIVVYSSTNKVYGDLKGVKIGNGVTEKQNLDFHSPYGCCYSSDTDVLTKNGWKKFFDVKKTDKVLTYNLKRKLAEYQIPIDYFEYQYSGKMYVQHNRRLETCVTPHHNMLVSWDCNHDELENPKILPAKNIYGKTMAYLLAANVDDGKMEKYFKLPEIKVGEHKHRFKSKLIPMNSWLRFLGWYLSEGNCNESSKTGNCRIVLTTFYRIEEAINVMIAIGLSPVIDHHHIVATSRQLYEYLKNFGKSHDKYIPFEIKQLHPKQLNILLKSLLDGDGNQVSKNSWRYTTVSSRLADDFQEIAIRCGMSASKTLDKQGFFRVHIGTTKTAQCNQGKNRSEWIDYNGKTYCLNVPNSILMVRQNGRAYFSGNSKGSADQYVRDYYRIYDLPTIVFRQSCVYGERQMGIEDQGWLAHFAISALKGRSINIFGDGKQVRDLLYVQDLIDAYLVAVKNIKKSKGEIFNIGGGKENAISIIKAIRIIEKKLGIKIKLKFLKVRPGDQKVFISNNSKIKKILGFKLKTNYNDGLDNLIKWLTQEKTLEEKKSK